MHGNSMLNIKLTRSIFSVILKYLLLTIISLAPILSFAQSQSSVNLAQQMYVAYYGRAGDPEGVNFWASQFDESSDLDAVLSNFGNSEEYSDNFGSLSHEELVSGLFQQMFNRSPDPGGLEFYVGRLESGEATLASIAKQIADGTQGGDDELSLDNKIAVANTFTNRIESEGIEYASADISGVRTLLSAVTSSASSVDAALLEVSAWVPQSSPPASNSNVIMTTNYGVIEIELFPEQAPITVANFLAYIETNFYDDLIFHRVIRGFMIQGGGFDIAGVARSTLAPITLEADKGLSNVRGNIAMARTSVPDSATSQFFINHVDNLFLDSTGSNDGYAVFGTVVNGMDVVDAIADLATVSVGSFADLPAEPVIIESVVVASGANKAPLAKAKAGPDQSVNTFQTVYLNGNGSSDPDGDTRSYSWPIVSAPAGINTTVNNTQTSAADFTPGAAGTFIFDLVVNDDTSNSSAVVITVGGINTAPLVDAGPDRSVNTFESVYLNGANSSDVDGDSLTYSWTFLARPSGSNASLYSTTTAVPYFTPDVAGSYTFDLKVHDGTASSSSTDRVVITAADLVF